MTLGDTARDGQHSKIETVADDLGIRLDQRGAGKTALVLHGGGGPASVFAFADDLAKHYHVITPTHPGFADTTRPSYMSSVKDLARSYALLIERSSLQDVLVIGFSLGGWVAAEMAASHPNGIAGLVLVDAVGIEVPGQDVLDVFSIAPNDIASFSYHAPDRFRIDMAKLTEQQAMTMRSNFAALAVYGRNQNMQDPELRGRLVAVELPALVVWGESDRVVFPEYGRSYATAFPNTRFELIPECGHSPQIERPQRLLELVQEFNRGLGDGG
jgi:pimeloyl-ACP methyl ester carboxylesterase